MNKKALLMMAVLAAFLLLTVISVSAQTAVAPAPMGAVNAASVVAPAPVTVPAQPSRPGYATRNVYTYPNGYAYPQPQYYNNYRGRRAVSFQEYFGFDGIPFNGSHIQAFRRYRGGF